jgi:hypothetical protein
MSEKRYDVEPVPTQQLHNDDGNNVAVEVVGVGRGEGRVWVVYNI